MDQRVMFFSRAKGGVRHDADDPPGNINLQADILSQEQARATQIFADVR